MTSHIKKSGLAIMGIRGIPANYGGFETCAEQTAIRLKQWFDVSVFCRSHNQKNSQTQFHDIKLVTLPSLNSKSLDTLSHTLLCALNVIFKPSIRYVHLYNAANAIYIPLLRLFGKRVVVSVDGLEWKRAKWGPIASAYSRLSAWLAVKMANGIVADSRVVQDYYRQILNCDAVYIPYGFASQISPQVELLKKFALEARKYLFFVGRLVPEKGVDRLIKTYNKLKTDMPLVIIGDDDNTEYVQYLKNLANDQVKFLGYVYGDEYHAVNAFPYFYVSASQLEGTSPSLVAAMSAGNCVLVNGIAENLETIGPAGLAYSENDDNDLEKKMTMLIKDPDQTQQVRTACKEFACLTYNWDTISKQYRDLLTGKRHST